MITITKLPDENNFGISFEEYYDIESMPVAITGNNRLRDLGDKLYLDIIAGNYYDDELAYDYDAIEELESVTGKRWNCRTMRGYSQGDWQNIYYAEGEVSEAMLDGIEDIYMGKYYEYEIDDEGEKYIEVVPHRIAWDGKNAICEYFGIRKEDCVLLEPCGYVKTYKYREVL